MIMNVQLMDLLRLLGPYRDDVHYVAMFERQYGYAPRID